MCAQPAAQEDTSAVVAPSIQPRMPWRVADVEALPGFRLRVRFLDGTEGIVDMAGLIASPGAGVFAALADAEVFARAYVEHGAVTWPGEIDLAPDAMYAEIKRSGEWVLPSVSAPAA